MTSSPASPSGSGRTRLGIDDLEQEVILPTVQAILRGAFHGHARTHDLRQAVDVDRLAGRGATRSRGASPRSRARRRTGRSRARSPRKSTAICSATSAIVSAYDGVAHSTRAPKSRDQRHLAFGAHHPTSAPPRRRAARRRVHAQAPGEKAIAVRVVHHVARPHAGAVQRARHQARPRCRCRRACSRPPSACRWCPTTRGGVRAARTGRANRPNG